MSGTLEHGIMRPIARVGGCLFWGMMLFLLLVCGFVLAALHVGQLLFFVLLGGIAASIGFFLYFRHVGRRGATAGSHGTARWGDPRPHIRPAGMIVGRVPEALLRYEAEGHLLTVAPTGTGKGVSAVIPNLLDYPGAVVVNDLKGENYAVTHERRAELGRVIALDPFRISGAPDAAVNPLDLIDAESEVCDADAATLAYLLVLPSTEGDSAFWDDEAAALLGGLILYVAAIEPTERRHLGTVREYLTASPDDWHRRIAEMAASRQAHGLIARAANRLAQKSDRERSGVVSTAQRHTHFLDSPAILRTLTHSTAQLRQLKTEALSLYCILPPERLGSHGRWLRLLAGSAIHAMMRTPGLPAHRVLFLLDEFAQLGRMQPVEQALTLLRGYGVRLWLLVQDFSQIQATYGPKADSILANAAVLQAFGTNDVKTAEYLSRRTGQATVWTSSENRTTGQSLSHNLMPTQQRGTAQSTSETGRPLLMPDEIMRMDQRRELLFLTGYAPLLVDRVNYLRDPEFAARFGSNPLHQAI